MTIAHDNTGGRPASWEMHKVLVIATIIGAVGVVFSFGLFLFSEQVLHLLRTILQTI